MEASVIKTNEFRNVLTALMSADNAERSNAESAYEKIDGQEKCLLLLWALGDDGMNLEEAELAAVLFRRLIANEYESVFAKLPIMYQQNIKAQLLIRLSHSIHGLLRRKICDLTAELARTCIDDQGNSSWPEIWTFLFQSATSNDPLAREIALLMLSYVPNVFGNQQEKYLQGICQMLQVCLGNDQPMEVRVAAVNATSAFILANEKDVAIQRMLIPCLELLLNLFNEVLDTTGEPDEILWHLVDLVESCPQLFKSQLENLLKYCLKAVSDQRYPDSCRHLSLEVIITLCESAPKMIRQFRNGGYIALVVKEILIMMTHVDEDPDWEKEDDNSDEESDSTPIVAEGALDRLACALGGKTIFPIIAHPLRLLIHSGNWNERHAGLMAISAVGEGCHKKMIDSLQDIVKNVLPLLKDTNSRVCYAACNALGQMSTDFAPNFQKKFALEVIPELLRLLRDSKSIRVQTHAGAALVNFFEDCPKSILAPHMNDIVVSLENVLNSELIRIQTDPRLSLIEQVVVTLASLADSAQEKFCEFYEKFVPNLKMIIEHTSNEKKCSMLRGKTIECVSLIGLAVGREKFLGDANDIMKLLSGTHVEDDDPQMSYLIAAWARICKILGPEFSPYLPYVMQPVLKAAAIKPEIAVLDSEDMKVVGNDNDWEFVNLGEKHNFGIRTSGLDDKATACQMLVCYARELKEGFVDYVEETVQLMVPMLRFYFHDGVRIAAGEILPYLLESAKIRGEDYVRQMWAAILPPFLNALDAEPECEVLCEHLAAFSQCVELLGNTALKEDDVGSLLGILHKNLTIHFERSQTRDHKREEDEDDEVLEENLTREEDEDVYRLGKVSEVLCTMFSTYKQSFFGCFDTLLPHFIHLIEPRRPWTDQQWALCVFADIIENTGPDCARYRQYFLQPILVALSGKNADLKQTAAYALGVLGQYGGMEFAAFCYSTLHLLTSIIRSPDARTEENIRATENAISAITKFLMFHSFLDENQMIPQLLSWLPVWEDEEEVNCIYSYLCSLLERSHPLVIGKDNCVLPRIIEIFADTFLKEAIPVDSALGKRIITCMKNIQKGDEPLFNACTCTLTSQQTEILKALLN